jgi:hypothetical protein
MEKVCQYKRATKYRIKWLGNPSDLSLQSTNTYTVKFNQSQPNRSHGTYCSVQSPSHYW